MPCLPLAVPTLPNLYRPYFLPVTNPGWLVICPHQLPWGHPNLPLLLEELGRTRPFIVCWPHLNGSQPASARSFIEKWEAHIGPFTDHSLLHGKAHMYSGGILSALQNQPNWSQLVLDFTPTITEDSI